LIPQVSLILQFIHKGPDKLNFSDAYAVQPDSAVVLRTIGHTDSPGEPFSNCGNRPFARKPSPKNPRQGSNTHQQIEQV
jgi:hypothetical protein